MGGVLGLANTGYQRISINGGHVFNSRLTRDCSTCSTSRYRACSVRTSETAAVASARLSESPLAMSRTIRSVSGPTYSRMILPLRLKVRQLLH
jgi:hypothetical protein